MKLIVGLGNPGKKYEGTRHNVGFDVLYRLAKLHGDGQVKGRFQGETVDAVIGTEKVLLLCPLTFMNLSGQSVVAARDFFKLANEEILVICDDFNLPLGSLRMRAKGSSGGQKGLADIIQRLGGDDVPRLRFGIGSPPPNWSVVDFVLSRFTKEESDTVKHSVERAADAAADWVRLGVEQCMNRYN